MFIGVSELELLISHSHSLKEKRRVLKKVVDNLKNTFPVSVAEIDNNDLWQRATIGISIVSRDKVVIDRVFQKIPVFIDEMNICEIIRIDKEIFNW